MTKNAKGPRRTPKLVQCPLCSGQARIGAPRNGAGVESLWLIRPFSLRLDLDARNTTWCPFCEVNHPGRVRPNEAAAFILRFGDTQWITRIDFAQFMREIGAMRKR
jgi:hypothetical protein